MLCCIRLAPQSLPEQATGVLAALIRMEQHLLWLAALFVGHVQGLDHQLGIRLGRERPADHPPCLQNQHRRQVMPAALRPDVRDVATPHLIGTLDRELAVQPIGISGRSTMACL